MLRPAVVAFQRGTNRRRRATDRAGDFLNPDLLLASHRPGLLDQPRRGGVEFFEWTQCATPVPSVSWRAALISILMAPA